MPLISRPVRPRGSDDPSGPKSRDCKRVSVSSILASVHESMFPKTELSTKFPDPNRSIVPTGWADRDRSEPESMPVTDT